MENLQPGTAPKITPADIEAAIEREFYFTGDEAVRETHTEGSAQALELLTFCVLVLRNGFTVSGESACVSPENFDVAVGRKVARANAINKIWPLMGYELKSRIASPHLSSKP